MIQTFVDRWMANKEKVRAAIAEKHPESYERIVRWVIEAVTGNEYADAETPDPERIHAIDDGDYQGTLVFVIADKGYQPSDYWYVKVRYGSCSGCDTLQSIRSYDDSPPSEEQVNDYLTLCLHVVQGLKKMGDSEAL